MTDSSKHSRRRMVVEMVIDGVTNVDVEHELCIRYKCGRHRGETELVEPSKGTVVWNQLVQFKTTFKINPMSGAFEPKPIVLSLRGRRGRTTYTLGTLDFDLSSYIQDVPVTSHYSFSSGSVTLPDAQFVVKVRVLQTESGLSVDPIDMSSTLHDTTRDYDEDEDEDGENQDDDSEPLFSKLARRNKNKFIVPPEELDKRGPVTGAFQIQGFEEELRDYRARFTREKKDLAQRHQRETERLLEQIRGLNLEHEAKLAEVNGELEQAKQMVSSGTVSMLRKGLENTNAQLEKKSKQVEQLRTKLEDTNQQMVELKTHVSRLESHLARAKKDLTSYTAAEKLKREEEMSKRKHALKGSSSDSLATSSSTTSTPPPTAGKEMLSARRQQSVSLSPQGKSSWIHIFSVVMLFVAFGFFLVKKLWLRQ